jgi:uncharacterized protein (TIGR03084 family)
MDEAVGELDFEIRELDEFLAGLRSEQWLQPTPAEGWDVRDQVSHLADTSEICLDMLTGGPRDLNTEALAADSPEGFTLSGVERGRRMSPEEVLAWWRGVVARQSEALRAKDARDRVPWGLGMSARMMATARLMEHWAHGLDIRSALGAGPNVSPRLRSIAILVLKAVPYALTVAKVEQPPGMLRAELTYDDEVWRLGPDDADNVIVGDAIEFCMLGVQRTTRDRCPSLGAKGDLADVALSNLRAYL